MSHCHDSCDEKSFVSKFRDNNNTKSCNETMDKTAWGTHVSFGVKIFGHFFLDIFFNSYMVRIILVAQWCQIQIQTNRRKLPKIYEFLIRVIRPITNNTMQKGFYYFTIFLSAFSVCWTRVNNQGLSILHSRNLLI